MSFLHANEPSIIHADLKTPNVLVDLNWRCKISDFGLTSMTLEENISDLVTKGEMGSILWTAPELFSNCKASMPHRSLIAKNSKN